MASSVPLIGRLHGSEYFALGISFVLLSLELFVRSVTLLLPSPLLRWLYRLSRNAFNALSSPYSLRARNRRKNVSSSVANAPDFVEICELYGYRAEEHVVQTHDGYLLGIHRLPARRGEEEQRINSGPGSISKKVVYLHHGLLMNSEVWVAITEEERCLPFTLVDQGYDVWLGNNRGNKYSKKSMHCSPTDHHFWNFSMDQFAFHDIPDSINYILSTTQQPSLSYIGFSQGSAQAFAALSINPLLNAKVDVFVALAPAMAPPGLASGVVSSLVKSNPQVLYLAFGRRAILGSVTMWQALLYPAIFAWVIDKAMTFLFGWKMLNITPHQKLAAYPHLYSFSSTKCVVHWFQIINNGKFQMFDDETTGPTSFSTGSKYYKVAKFPTKNIKTPIVLVYGGADSLVDIQLMMKELPRHTVAKCVPKYEHLDLLWASDVDTLVFPHVLQALETFMQPAGRERLTLSWQKTARPSILDHAPGPTPNGSAPLGYSEDEAMRNNSRTAVPFERPPTREEQLDESDYDGDYTEEHENLTFPPSAFTVSFQYPLSNARAVGNSALRETVRSTTSASSATPVPSTLHDRGHRQDPVTPPPRDFGVDTDAIQTTVTARQDSGPGSQRRRQQQHQPQSPGSSGVVPSTATDETVVRSRPEGWWSSTSSSMTSLVDPS